MRKHTSTVLQTMMEEPHWAPLRADAFAKRPCAMDAPGAPCFDANGILVRISSAWLIARCCDYDATETSRIDKIRKKMGDCRPTDLMLSFCRSQDRDARAGHTLLEGDILSHALDYVLYADSRVAISMNVGITPDSGYSWPRVFRVREPFLPLDSRKYAIRCAGGGHSWVWNGRVWNNPVHGPLDGMAFVQVSTIPQATPLASHPDLFEDQNTPIVLGETPALKLRYDPEGNGYCPLCGRTLSEYVTPKRKDRQ